MAKVSVDRSILIAAFIVGCLTKFMLTTKTLFDTGIILGKMHCSRNWSCFEANSNQLNAL